MSVLCCCRLYYCLVGDSFYRQDGNLCRGFSDNLAVKNIYYCYIYFSVMFLLKQIVWKHMQV